MTKTEIQTAYSMLKDLADKVVNMPRKAVSICDNYTSDYVSLSAVKNAINKKLVLLQREMNKLATSNNYQYTVDSPLKLGETVWTVDKWDDGVYRTSKHKITAIVFDKTKTVMYMLNDTDNCVFEYSENDYLTDLFTDYEKAKYACKIRNNKL